MNNLDFGKVVTIVIAFLVAAYFLGDKALYMYKHQDDLRFNLNHITYTKELFDTMEADEKEILLTEISNLCVRKHYADELTCGDTAYWFANALDAEGVDEELVVEWMPTCTYACQTQAAPLPVPEEKSTNTSRPKQKPGEPKKYGGATKWFWE